MCALLRGSPARHRAVPGLILDAPAPGLLCLAASQPDETVRELKRVPGGPRVPVSPLTLSLHQRLMRQPALTVADLMNGLAQDHRRWRLPQHPRLEAAPGDTRRAFLGGPPARFPRPFVLVTGVAEDQVTLCGGAALGLCPRDRLACYAPQDLGVHQAVGTVEITRTTCPDTANQAAYDTRLKKYVAYIRLWNPMRKVGRVEMDDILQPWPCTPAEKPYYIWGEDKIPVTSVEVPTVFSYDDQDPMPSDHYNATAVPYPWADDAYFLFPSAYLHFPDPPVGKYGNDGLLDVQMAVSRDGIAWTRLDRRPYIGLSPEGYKDSQQLYMAIGMLRSGGDLFQYYGGFETTHGDTDLANRPPIGSICRAVQQLDGFVSADAAFTGGELLTPPLVFRGGHLELNVDTSALGEVRVGLLNAEGEPLPGYTAGRGDPIHGNFLAKTVTWGGQSDLSALAGQPIRPHFVLRAAKLYAFQFAAGTG